MSPMSYQFTYMQDELRPQLRTGISDYHHKKKKLKMQLSFTLCIMWDSICPKI